jgi:hypothetical protein
MRIWRIAGFTAALCAGGVSLLFGYRLFWREASSAPAGSGFGTFRDFLVAEVLVVLFVLVVVTFPYYWAKSVQLWWTAICGGTPIQREELKHHLIGFAASCTCLLLTFLWTHLFTNLTVW